MKSPLTTTLRARRNLIGLVLTSVFVVGGLMIVVGASASIVPILGGVEIRSSARSVSKPSECSSHELKLVLSHSLGAEGTGYYYFTATNESDHDCELNGFFDVVVLGKQHVGLSRGYDRVSTNANGEPVSKVPVILKPSRNALTVISVAENPSGSDLACPLISAFRITPPRDHDAVTISRGRMGTGLFCQRRDSPVTIYETTYNS